MKLAEILEEYQTKTGQEIEMVRIEDSEGDNNRGWQVDKVEAHIDGEPVGYLKASYIPHSRFHKYYPTIFNYLDQIKGKSYLPYKKDHLHYQELTDEERRKLLRSAYLDLRLVPYGEEKNVVEQMSDREVLQAVRDLEDKLQSGRIGDDFKRFKNFHKDKPLVDYINVDDKHQRQRIGQALYREAAKWMKEKGMELYASGLQSKSAQASWEHMRDRVKKAKRGRRILRPV